MAQSPPVLKPLAIGDNVPDLRFSKILNAPYSSTSITAWSDKLLLLDFWATWCSACIREFPKFDSLQQQFKDRLNILLVDNPKSGDTPEKINALLQRKKNPAGKKYSMAVVPDGTSAGNLFPHRTLPHTVWIYKGKVKAITEAAAVTASNIKAVLDGTPVMLPVKYEQMDFDPMAPLLLDNNGGDITATISRSLFTRYLEGAGGTTGQSSLPGHLKRWFFINQPIVALYSFCFPGIAPNRIQLKGLADSAFFQKTNEVVWNKEHRFCYELTVPENTPLERVHAIMKADLDKQFMLFSGTSTTAVDCFVLQQLPEKVSLQQPFSCGEYSGITRDEQENWKLCKIPVSTLIENLNWQRAGQIPRPVIIDESGYTGFLNFNLGIPDLHVLPALRSALEKNGFTLIPATRNLPVLILSPSTEN